MEFSIPLGVSAMRGVGRPDRGCIMIDFVTTAPISVMSKNWSSSRPYPAQPDAVITGDVKVAQASSVLMSTSGSWGSLLPGAITRVSRVMGAHRRLQPIPRSLLEPCLRRTT